MVLALKLFLVAVVLFMLVAIGLDNMWRNHP